MYTCKVDREVTSVRGNVPGGRRAVAGHFVAGRMGRSLPEGRGNRWGRGLRRRLSGALCRGIFAAVAIGGSALSISAFSAPGAVPPADVVALPTGVDARPQWSLDVTPLLRSEVRGEAGVSLFRFASEQESRAWGLVPGETIEWAGEFSVPAESVAGRPMVLEVDECRLVRSATLDGKPLPAPEFAYAQRVWSEGRGVIRLSTIEPGRKVSVRLATRWLDHLYPNGIGRVVLRPATLQEQIAIDKPEAGRVGVRNLTDVNQRLTVRVRHTDYFGVELAKTETTLDLTASGRGSVALDAPANPWLYKTEIVASDGRQQTLPHWQMTGEDLWTKSRSEVIALATGWEYAVVPTTPPGSTAVVVPADAVWEKVAIPHAVPPEKYKSRNAVYRTKFKVPAGWADSGRRVRMMLPMVWFRATIVVNGKELATLANWQTPATIDLTDVLNPGDAEQELVVGIRDWTAGLADTIAVPPDGVNAAPDRALIAAIPHLNQSWAPKHLGMVGVPELMSVPEVRADWARITTEASARTTLRAEVEVRNVGKSARRVRVEGTVLQRGVEVAKLPVAETQAGPGVVAKVTLASEVASATRWTPETPELYELRVRVLGEDGTVLDTRRERFGFREFGIRGSTFTLNGERFMANGSGHILLPDNLWPVTPLPYRIIRHNMHAVPGFIGGVRANHFADEMGVLIKDENLVHNAHAQERYAYQLPQTWENIFSEFEAVFRTRPNHPSSVMYGVGNEIVFSAGDEPKKMGDLFRRLREMDPARLVTVSGSFPVPEGAEIVDLHGRMSPHDRSDHWMYNPAGRPAYLREEGMYVSRPPGDAGTTWAPGQMSIVGPVPADGSKSRLLEYGGRPIILPETSYIEQDLFPGLLGLAAWQPVITDRSRGDFAFENGFFPLTAAKVRRTAIQMARQSGVPMFLLHVDRGITRAIAQVALFPEKPYQRLVAGAEGKLGFTLHNDLTVRTPIRARVSVQKDGVELAKLERTLDVPTATITPLELPVGKLEAGTYDLLLEASAEDGRFYYRQWYSVHALPPASFPAVAVDVFDPSGKLTTTLRGRGVNVTPVTQLDAWDSAQRSILVAGDALKGVDAKALEALRAKIAGGGRAVVLDHRVLPGFLSTRLDQKLGGSGNGTWQTNASRVDLTSPLLEGLTSEDLRFWSTSDNDYASVRSPLRPPMTGEFRVHAMAGGRLAEVEEVPLLQLREGKGEVVLCQFNLSGGVGVDPAADLILANLLRWAAPGTDSVPASAEGTKAAVLLAAKDSSLTPALARLGVQAVPVDSLEPPAASASQVLMVDGSDARLEAISSAARIRAFVENGGTLFVQGLDSRGAKWLSAVLGSEVKVEPFAHPRTVLARRTSLLDGYVPSDLFWAEWRNTDLTRSTKPQDTDVMHERAVGGGLVPVVAPAALSEANVGKGRVIVSTYRLTQYSHPKPARLLLTLARNLGIAIGAPGGSEEKDDSKLFAYRPIDLRSHANWGLTDDPSAEVRGWIKAGPQNDMSVLPTGTQTFGGVTFDVIDQETNGGKSTLALSGTKEIGVLPAEIKGIKVGGKAERLVFLHSAAWGSPGFTYRVWFADRKTWIPGQPDPFVDVVVRPGEHIADYFDATPILKGYRSLRGAKVAWSGASAFSRPMERVVGVYSMAWDNPSPEKEIESIDVLSPGKVGSGQVFVVAITAADRKPPLKLGDVLPAGVQPADVAEWVQTERYGLVMLKSGSVAVIHDASGRPLMTTSPWMVQTSRRKDDGTREWGQIDSQVGSKGVVVRRSQNPRGETVLAVEGGTSPRMNWNAEVVCGSSSIAIRHGFEVTDDMPTGVGVTILMGMKVEPTRVKAGFEPKPVRMPIDYPLEEGSLRVTIPEKFVRWFSVPGYRAEGTSVTFSPAGAKELVKGNRIETEVTVEVP